MPHTLNNKRVFKGGSPNKCIVCTKPCGKHPCCKDHKNDPRCKKQNTGNSICIVCNKATISKQLLSKGSKCCKNCIGKNDSRCPTISGGPQQQPQQTFPQQTFPNPPYQQLPFPQLNNNNIGFKSKKDRRDKEDKLRIKGKEVKKNLDRIKKTLKKITKITKKRNRYSKRYLELLENIDETLKHLYYKTESGDSKNVKTKSKKKYRRNKSSTSSS